MRLPLVARGEHKRMWMQGEGGGGYGSGCCLGCVNGGVIEMRHEVAKIRQ